MKQLAPIPLVGPGFLGLNKQRSSSTNLEPQWALELQNCVFDDTSRVAARKGWTNQTSSPMSGSPNVEQLHEFVNSSGTSIVVSAANNKLWSAVTTPTDVTGALTPSANNWQFVNFMDRVIGIQISHTMISYNGSGNFAVIAPSSGSLPNGNSGVAAFGRLWVAHSNGYQFQWCGLLDYQNWGAAGSGSMDMRNIWMGNDQIVGMAAFGAFLVVFGRNQIVTFTSPSGSTLGLDPATMMVADKIVGTGLLSRDSIQHTDDGDLLYLSPFGVQSLSRAIFQKDNPVSTVNQPVQDYLNQMVAAEPDVGKIRSVFSPVEHFYLLILPSSGHVFCLNTQMKFNNDDGSQSYRTTEWIWAVVNARSGLYHTNRSVLFGFNGRIGLYANYSDNGNTYHFVYNSPNLDGGAEISNRKKIGKELGVVLLSLGDINVVFKWGYDFQGFQHTYTQLASGGQVPEYGRAEYGTNGVYDVNDPNAVAGTNYSEYGGSITLRILQIPLSDDGRWFQLALEADIAAQFSLQQLDWFGKLGRMT